MDSSFKVDMNCQQSYPLLPPAYAPPQEQHQQPNVTINMAAQQQQPPSNPTFIMAPQQQQPSNPTIIMAPQQQPTSFVMVGKTPVQTTCNNCKNQVVSRVEKKLRSKAYWIGLLLCCLGCDLGCCLIPCCLDSMKTFHHTCPSCQGYIGRFEE
jgi:lipopolysaccharide-induced tumor necrosis factor-alpha factor